MTDRFDDSTAPRTGSLPVPGATLRYQVRGSGPLVLLIPGGAGETDEGEAAHAEDGTREPAATPHG